MRHKSTKRQSCDRVKGEKERQKCREIMQIYLSSQKRGEKEKLNKRMCMYGVSCVVIFRHVSSLLPQLLFPSFNIPERCTALRHTS